MTKAKPIGRPSPSPWILDSDEDGESAILCSNGGEVGCIWANDGHGLANATLIASAPAMLKALAAIHKLACEDQDIYGGLSSRQHEIRDIAIAAIMAAEGKDGTNSET